MTSIAMLLALLPAIVLAAPIWDKIEYVYTPKDTLAETNITVYNTMPVEVGLYLTHMRGDDGDTKGARRWGYGRAGDVMDGYYPLRFETTRKDWDKWQAAIQFRDPDWFIWTDVFYGLLGLEHADKSVGFNLSPNGIITGLSGGVTQARFTTTGTNFPKEATGINSFFFLEVRNDFKDLPTSVSVELMTRTDGWWQEQTFIQEKGNSNITYLPFFFESNATKDYSDLFKFKVSRHAAQALTSGRRPCEMLPGDSGDIMVATVNSTGWSIETYNGREKGNVRCDGKWESRKNDVDGDDYEEEL